MVYQEEEDSIFLIKSINVLIDHREYLNREDQL